MKLKHTPGKWVIMPEEVGRDYIRIRGSALGKKYKIANVLHAGDIFNNLYEKETEEVRANARLIAAAPDMLDVLIVEMKNNFILPVENRIFNLDKIKQSIESATGLSIEEVLK